MNDGDDGARVVARIAGSVTELDAAQWDACAGRDNPFVRHAFLSALEASGSVGGHSGWTPCPVVIEDATGKIAAALPAYLKQHSQGEYVFDQGWADAWMRAGGDYYPKLQIAVPFTPVPGPRLLLRPDRPDLARALAGAARTLVDREGLSSAHATFLAPDQVALFEQDGWLIREDNQFHWENRGYASFDDFLAALSSSRRKTMRKERARAVEGLTIRWITGADIREADWDAFWIFYQDTGARKWGRPYLTRAFFPLLAATMPEAVLLMTAERDGRPIAAALHLVGTDTLYGRYWGCTEDVPNLHFELCYYQAIDYAIAHGLRRIEAGAQGGHKLARGYEPVATRSAHYIADAGFRAAVADFLERERQLVALDRRGQARLTPFRKEAG